MLTIDRTTLIAALQDLEGVPLVSYGRPRDAFKLERDVPYWSSGISIAEMPHTNVPKGAMVAVGDLERFGNMSFALLKEALPKIDIYPLGDDGDFSPKTGQSQQQYVAELEKWFTDRSVIDPALHPQTELAPAIGTLGHLTADQRNELIEHCTDHLHIFRNPRTEELLPPGRHERKEITESLFNGIVSTQRYTRKDAPALAYQFMDKLTILPDSGTTQGAITYPLSGPKLIVLREENGKPVITPLDIEQIGKTYVTQDGLPLGERGAVDLSLAVDRPKTLRERYEALPSVDWDGLKRMDIGQLQAALSAQASTRGNAEDVAIDINDATGFARPRGTGPVKGGR